MLDFVRTRLSYGVLCLFACVMLCTGCTVGLGSEVDVEAPNVAITSPSDSSVCNNTITLSGTFTDDTGVKNVYVELYSLDSLNSNLLPSGTEASMQGEATSGTWSYSLDTTALQDGSYKALVYAKDGSYTSTKMPVTFDIDNTAPLVLLTSPNSLLLDDPAAYGTSVNVAGEVSDDHKVKSMTVAFYDKDNNPISISKSTFTGFSTAGGMDVTVAKYYDTEPSDADSLALYNNYNALYNKTSGGTQYYYMYVSLTDAAGNSSSYAYINSKLKSYIKDKTSLSSSDWTIDNLKEILNGTYSGSISSDNQKIIRQILKGESSYKTRSSSEDYLVNSSTLLALSVNVDASPTYELTNNSITLDTLRSDNSDWSQASSQGSISITVSSGLNGTYVCPSTLGVSLYKADIYGNKTSSSPYAVIDSSSITNSSGKAVASISTSVSTGTYNVALPKLSSNTYYLVEVTGEDEDSSSLSSKGKLYGFYVPSSGKIPSAQWGEESSDGKIYNPLSGSYHNSMDFYLSGTVTTESTLKVRQLDSSAVYPVWCMTATDMDTGTDYTLTGYPVIENITAEENTAISSSTVYSWYTDDIFAERSTDDSDYADYNALKELLTDGVRLNVSLTVTFSNEGGEYSLQRSFYADTDKPVVEFSNVTPVVDTDYVNGKITISAQASDGNLKSVKLTASDGTTTKEIDNSGSKYSFSGTLDTTDFVKDDTETLLTLTYTGYDKAGNFGTVTKQVKIKQTTDCPSITMSNADLSLKDESAILKAIADDATFTNIFNQTNNSTLIGSVTDDDGLASVKVVAKNGDTETVILDKNDLGGTTSYSISSASLSSLDQGTYIITVTASDSLSQTSYSTSSVSFAVGIDNGSPSFSSVTPADDSYFSSAISVSGIVSDADEAVTLQMIEGPSHASSLYSTAQTVSSGKSWNDTVTLSSPQDGSYTLVYKATDKWGQSSTYSIKYKVDTTAPKSYDNPVIGEDYLSSSAQTLKLHLSDASSSTDDYYSGIDSVTYEITGATQGSGQFGKGTLYKDSSSSYGSTEYIYNYSATFTLLDGENYITVKATDNAGNTSIIAGYTYNIDSVSPVIDSLTSSAQNNIINTSNIDSVSLTASITELLSGVKTVSVLKGSSTVASLDIKSPAGSSTSAKYTISINSSDISNGENTFAVVAQDASLNSSAYSYITLKCDTVAPKVKVTSPVSTSTVDKTITLSGTVSDNVSDISELTGVGVQVYNATSASWEDISNSTVSIESDGSWTSSAIDTTQYSSSYDYDSQTKGDQVYFRAVIKDSYGNLNTDSGITDSSALNGAVSYTVDQNNDRPKITFASLTVGSDSNKIKGTKTVTGTVEDADGIISGMWYITEADYTDNKDSFSYPTLSSVPTYWTSVSVDGTSWSAASTAEDGETTWYFYVIDKEGTAFFTLSDSEYSRPYLISCDTTALIDNTDGITFRLDTNNPVMSSDDLYFYVSSTQTYSESLADWTSGKTSGIAAGGEQKYVYIRAKATDNNGIASISTTLDSSAKVTKVESSSTSLTAVLGPVDVSALSSTSTNVTVTATDNFGLTTDITVTIVIDNTPPSVSMTYPLSDSYITSAFNARGTAEDNAGGTGVASIKYMIPTREQASKGSASLSELDSWTEYTNSTSTWSLSFDFNASDTSSSAGNIITYANSTYATETVSDSGIWIVPVYFNLTDKLGNSNLTDGDDSNDCVYIYVQPDADIPTASISYPTEGLVLGGTIQSYGGATDNTAVGSVYVQLDADGDGDFDDDDYDYIYNNWYKDYTSNGTLYSRYSTLTYYTTSKVTESVHKSNLSSAAFTGEADDSSNVLTLSKKNTATWGIKVNGTTSWNFSLNESSELDDIITAAGVSNKDFGIRVLAVDTDGTAGSAWTEGVTFTIDADIPSISTPVLTQYDSKGNQISQTSYSADVWLSGTWYIEADLTDAEGISEVYFKKTTGSSSSLELYAISYNASTKSSTYNTSYGYRIDSDGNKSDSGRNFHIKVPVDISNADSDGNISSSLTVYDSASNRHSTTYAFSINIDNTPPSIFTQNNSTFSSSSETSSSLRIMQGGYSSSGTLINSENSISQSNYTYTLGDRVEESGSGFKRLALYFERIPETVTSSNPARIYDPMLDVTSASNKITLESTSAVSSDKMICGKVYINEDNLPVMYISDAVRDSTTSLTSTYINSDNIRKGGIIKIGGIYRTITSVSGTTVDFDSSVDVSYTSCEVVYAQIVDHLTVESAGSYNTSTGLYSVTNDDGDGMIETLERTGSTYAWTASVNSKHISDGPVQIHVVAFDEAGNITHGYIASSIENNHPRITRVFLGTDYDGSGDFNFKTSSDSSDGSTYFGEFNYYASDDTTNGSDSVTLSSSAFKAKDGLVIVPEFVGSVNGGSLTYSVKADISDSAFTNGITQAIPYKTKDGSYVSGVSYGTMTDLSSVATVESGSAGLYKMTGSNGVIYYTSSDLSTLLGGDDNCSLKNTMLSFTFFDATDETVQGYNSQTALLNVPLVVDVVDTTAATVKVDDFYFNNLSDNSLYQSSSDYGHIELPSDLPESKFTSSSGVYDKDPKVSGIIVIRGSASDDQRIDSIKIKYGTLISSYITVATYDKTKTSSSIKDRYGLNYTDTLSTNGWTFNITSETLNQSGHFVDWEFTVDTSKITSSAASDVVFSIMASDHTQKTSNDSDDGIYQMDVVPYITKITTSLSSLKSNNPSVYDRTALGHYPVNGGAPDEAYDKTANSGETIYVYGFNLGTAPQYTSSTYGTTTLTASSTKTGSYEIASSKLDSGDFDLTVNSIPTLNNVNNNDACGSYKETMDTSTYGAYAYNRQPNGDSNNLLTDDVILDVWEINNRAVPTISGNVDQVVMKVNPLDGQLSFAFANGPLYFSMGGYNATAYNSSTSYDYWQGSYDFFTSIGYAIDSLGNSYGVAAGGDINSSSADNFSLYSSRWGVSGRGNYGSYSNTNTRRLEQIAQNNNGVYDFNKYRILSPGLATAVHGSDTGLYLVYYDDINEEIRFRAGLISGTTSGKDYGNFVDEYTSSVPQSYSHANVNLLAGGDTGYNAGEYCDVAVISSESSSVDDVVVVIWYDNINKKLLYTYSTRDFLSTTTKGTTEYGTASGKNGFVTPREVFSDSNIGEYCKIAVDKNGGVHIAAYDSINTNLVYAYASSYSSSFKTCVVDSYGSIGTEITLDVAYSGSGSDSYAVPYIGYYSSNKKPKLAYPVSSSYTNGVSNEEFTGTWESTIIPTSSTVPEDHINIGVKKSGGVIANSTTTSSLARSTDALQNGTSNGYSSSAWGHVYANGTVNPVVGYGIKVGTTGYIETAQIR